MKQNLHGKFSGIIIPAIVLFFNVFIILHPKEIIGASSAGISLWFNNVFPSLLPFIVGANILTGLGFVHFLGTLLEPLMYPAFGVPGCGGFALVAGMTSGYPMGAKITGDLCRNGELTSDEAQRLISFTNNSGPLFILGAVGIGMFHNSRIGYFIMAVHYGAAIITGLLFKYYKCTNPPATPRGSRIVKKAFTNMRNYRLKNAHGFGQILADSVTNSMETILVVGGFITLFCVLVKIIELTNLTHMIIALLAPVLHYVSLPEDVFNGIFVGLMEVTNGTQLLSVLPQNAYSVISAAAIISFGGFSIHAQSIGFLQKTGVRAPIYIFSKVIHSIIATVLGIVTYQFVDFKPGDVTVVEASTFFTGGVLDKFIFSSAFFLIAIAIICVVVILSYFFYQFNHDR